MEDEDETCVRLATSRAGSGEHGLTVVVVPIGDPLHDHV